MQVCFKYIIDRCIIHQKAAGDQALRNNQVTVTDVNTPGLFAIDGIISCINPVSVIYR
jgi:hypothetical protein